MFNRLSLHILRLNFITYFIIYYENYDVNYNELLL